MVEICTRLSNKTDKLTCKYALAGHLKVQKGKTLTYGRKRLEAGK
jgi:hypothetical protein